MENLYLIDNIYALMNPDGPPCITPEQLSVFFGREYDASDIRLSLIDMEHNSELCFNTTVGGYQRKFSDVKKGDRLQRWVDAFWPIAYMGSENIEYVVRHYPPANFFVYTRDNKCYDFTVCESKAIAVFGKEQREIHAIEGVEDEVKHVAIIYERQIVDELKKYGYNVFALLDPETHKVEYL